jgi:hypothetical protein
MHLRRGFRIAVAVGCLAALLQAASNAETATLQVRINTTSLINHVAGPFSLAFVLTDGSGIQDGKSTATISNLNFGSGGPLGSSVSFGGATGDLRTSVTITNTSVLNVFSESFSPGKEVSFDLLLSGGRPVIDAFPSRLAIFILDRSGTPLPTLAPVGNYLLGVDLTPEDPIGQGFGSNPTTPPYIGTAVSIPTPEIDD